VRKNNKINILIQQYKKDENDQRRYNIINKLKKYLLNLNRYVRIDGKFCFPYILINTFGLRIDDVTDLLLGHSEIIRIPISANSFCIPKRKGPHNDSFNSPVNFYMHDLVHHNTIIKGMVESTEYLKEYSSMYLHFPRDINSFSYRFISLLLYMRFFEKNFSNALSISELFPEASIYSFYIKEHGNDFFKMIAHVPRATNLKDKLMEKIHQYGGVILTYDEVIMYLNNYYNSLRFKRPSTQINELSKRFTIIFRLMLKYFLEENKIFSKKI